MKKNLVEALRQLENKIQKSGEEVIAFIEANKKEVSEEDLRRLSDTYHNVGSAVARFDRLDT